MQFLLDIIPIVAFFAVYKGLEHDPSLLPAMLTSYMPSSIEPLFVPVYWATLATIVATLLKVVYNRVKKEPVSMTTWVSCALIVVFGGLTLYLQDPRFVQWKPTLLYGFMAFALLVGLVTKRNFLEKMLAQGITMPHAAWVTLQKAWIAFLFGMGGLNLVVVYTCSFDTWVDFKLWGTLILTILFTIWTGLFVSKHAQAGHNTDQAGDHSHN